MTRLLRPGSSKMALGPHGSVLPAGRNPHRSGLPAHHPRLHVVPGLKRVYRCTVRTPLDRGSAVLPAYAVTMHFSWSRRSVLLTWACAAVAACRDGDGGGITEPQPGEVQVAIATTGR